MFKIPAEPGVQNDIDKSLKEKTIPGGALAKDINRLLLPQLVSYQDSRLRKCLICQKIKNIICYLLLLLLLMSQVLGLDYY